MTKTRFLWIPILTVTIVWVSMCGCGDTTKVPSQTESPQTESGTPDKSTRSATVAREKAAVTEEELVEEVGTKATNDAPESADAPDPHLFRNVDPAFAIVFPERFQNEDLGSSKIIVNFMHEKDDATIRIFEMAAPDGPDAIYEWNRNEVKGTGGTQRIIKEGELTAGPQTFRWIVTDIPDLMPPIQYKHYLVPLSDTRVIWIHTRVPRSLFPRYEAVFDECVKTMRLGS